MRLTDEMVLQDNKRFEKCNALAELKYCGWEIPHRKSITNDEIRFYAWLCRSAIAMLKKQEARILDWDELEDWGNAVWFEDKDEHECYIALIANVGTYGAKFTNVEPGNIHSLVFMRDFYMKEWRCWSARPTTKQRQAVKWDG